MLLMFFVASYPKIPGNLKLKTTTTTLGGSLLILAWRIIPFTATNHCLEDGPPYVVSKGGYFRHLALDQPYFGDEN